MIELWGRLVGRRSDPPVTWAPFRQPIPEFNVNTMEFGGLRFGDPLESAAFLGRPEAFTWSQSDYCELLYASGGFQVDYERGKFAYLAFFIGPDKFVPTHKGFQFSKPRVRGTPVDGIEFSQDVDQPLIETLFGTADTVDVDAVESILFYNRKSVTMEFELDGSTGGLKRWNLYPQ